MADAAQLLTDIDSRGWVVLFALAIASATIRLHYAMVARVLKWLALVLFTYVATALYVGPDWGVVLRDTVSISIPHGSGAWATLVAILGTTISPYLFFWQASQEVEEEKALGRRRRADRVGATPSEVHTRSLDVGVGAFFSNLVMFFIILATALTLHRNGITSARSSREVAEALRPLAGRFAALLYTVGLVGTGMLAIPTLAGSAAYAFAEVFGWRQGIDERFRRAKAFYVVFGVSIAAGVALNFAKVNPITALYWTAVINGLLAPVLLTGIVLVASDRRLMAGQPSSLLARAVVAVTAAAMYAAAVAMFVL